MVAGGCWLHGWWLDRLAFRAGLVGGVFYGPFFILQVRYCTSSSSTTGKGTSTTYVRSFAQAVKIGSDKMAGMTTLAIRVANPVMTLAVCCGAGMDSDLQDIMQRGNYFYKHDYGRSKRSRKWMLLSSDGLALRWKSVGSHGDSASPSRGASSSRGSILRSGSFARYSTGMLAMRAEACCLGCLSSKLCLLPTRSSCFSFYSLAHP